MRPLRHWVGGALVVVVAATGCSGGSSDDSEDVVRPRAVQRFLERDLNESAVTPVEVGDVRCPRTVTKGNTASAACQVTINGTAVELNIERSGKGRLSRREAVIVVPKTEEFVAGQYDARLGLAVIVECGPEELLAVAPGATLDCTATDADGSAVAAVVTVQDLAGLVTVALA
jgi:hypothetical protein